MCVCGHPCRCGLSSFYVCGVVCPQVSAMEEKLRALHAKTVELETQLQVESRAKRSQQEANKKMANEEGNLRIQVADLQAKIEKTESERLRMEAEARDSSDQLREMAEKVFQLLERLKLVRYPVHGGVSVLCLWWMGLEKC